MRSCTRDGRASDLYGSVNDGVTDRSAIGLGEAELTATQLRRAFIRI
jgi:hypothetical protein